MTNDEKIARRIACEEAGYPYSEALFSDEEDYWRWIETGGNLPWLNGPTKQVQK
jgi:hypothetical protein